LPSNTAGLTYRYYIYKRRGCALKSKTALNWIKTNAAPRKG